MDRKVRPLIFLVSDREFDALQEAVDKFDLSRSEVLRRALRVGLPLLQVHLPRVAEETVVGGVESLPGCSLEEAMTNTER